MCYEVAKEMKAVMEAREREAAAVLKAVRGDAVGPMGLTPDAVKFSPEYRQAKADWQACWDAMRKFNAWFYKEFTPQVKAERRACNEAGIRYTI